jgi:hypothetical protein
MAPFIKLHIFALMKINLPIHFFSLVAFTLLLISVLKYASPHFQSDESQPVSHIDPQAKISSLEHNSETNSINGNPVNVPAPTINNLSNGSSFSATTDPAIALVLMHNENSCNGLFSVSGNPVFPHAQDSPRLHLTCMVFRI